MFHRGYPNTSNFVKNTPLRANFKTENGESGNGNGNGNGNGERGTENGESLKWESLKAGIFKSGNL